MTLQTKASGTVQREIDANAIDYAARWQTAQEVQSSVGKLGDFARPADVSIWPSWASRAFRVQVKSAVDPTSAQQPAPTSNQ